MLEILTVIAVMAIVLSLAAPSMNRLLTSLRSSSAIERVSSDLTLARSTAVRSGRTATLTITSATSYVITVPDATVAGGTRTVKNVSLVQDFPRTLLTPSTGTVSFNSRGLRSGATTVLRIEASSPTGVRSALRVSEIGRIYREH